MRTDWLIITRKLAEHCWWELTEQCWWELSENCRWELDENCQVRIGWELSGENGMRIVRWELDENCRWELDENCRWELQGHFWKSHLLLHENCRWELSIIFAWVARPSDLFLMIVHCELHCYDTAEPDNLATQWMRSSSAIILSHLIRNILISTQEILIFWENGLLNGSVYHLLEMIHYIPSQWLAFQTNPNIPKKLKQVTTTAVGFSPGGSDVRKFHPWFWLATKVP